jgi:hypothetical protein
MFATVRIINAKPLRIPKISTHDILNFDIII